MSLEKRDNMGFQIAPTLIIFLVILGAGFLVCVGFAIMRFYGEDADQTNWTQRSPEQDAYMKQVRERSWRRLPKYGQSSKMYSSMHIDHAPLSASTTTNG